MSLLSLKQFQELINTALEYQPRRDKFDGEHPSAEIFTGAGNIVNAIRLKFYVQDDGGTWDNITIIKPQFIWDMKKIMAGSVIDDGVANKNAHLTVSSISETDDGLNFYGVNTSYASNIGPILTSGLNMENTILNIWFRPYENINNTLGYLFMLFSINLTTIRFYLGIKTDPVNSERFQIRIFSALRTSPFYILDRIISGTSSLQFEWKKLYNVQISLQGTTFKIIVNGRQVHTETLTYAFEAPERIAIFVGSLYKGEISYATLSCYAWHDDNFLNSFWKYRYPLPRGPELVDLSDYFEQKGKNLLIDVGDINKAIENIRGQLYVKTNTVKLRDL